MDNILSEEFNKRERSDLGLDEIILNAFDNHKLIFFLGAGVSRVDGICGWEELANNLIKKAFPNYKEYTEIINSGMSSKEKISIAHSHFKKIGKLNKFYSEFGKALKSRKRCNKNIINNVGNIYDILSQLGVNYITTNADSLFELQLGSECCYEVLDSSKLLTDNKYYRRNQLFYLHGKYKEKDIEHNENNLVFTADKYVEKYNDTQTVNFLNEIFTPANGFVVFFIGYGLNEFELLDYIASKLYLKNRKTKDGKGQNNVFALEGFCSNQSLLFEVRKNYLRSLGVELLAYNMDKNGYSELKNVLSKILTVFQNRPSQMYYDFTDVEKFTKQYTQENEQQLRLILKPKNAKVFQYAITQLEKSSDFDKWGAAFLRNNEFFLNALQDYFDNTTIGLSKLYFLLFLVQNGIEDSQHKTSILLDNIDNAIKKDDILNNNRELAMILSMLISNLDAENIKSKYINLLTDIFSTYTITIFHGFKIDKNFRIIKWTDELIEYYLDAVLSGVYDLDSMYNVDAYILINFINSFDEITQYKFVNIVFDSIMNHIINKTSDGSINEVLIEGNLDTLYNSKYYEYWKFYLQKLCIYFSLIKDFEIKKQLLKKYLNKNNETVKKISLYLIRKNQMDVSIISEYGASCFNNSYCISELYLCLRGAKKTREDNLRLFKKIIDGSCFGFAGLNDNAQLLNMQKNSFYDVLGLPINNDYEIYNFASLTQSCEPIIVSDDNFEMGQEVKRIVEADSFIMELEIAQQKYGKKFLLHYNLEFANELLKLDDDKFNKKINEIKENYDYEFINSMICAFVSKLDGLTSVKEKSIQNFCLDILIKITKDNFTIECNKNLCKNIFYLMSKKPLSTSVIARSDKINKLYDIFSSLNIDVEITFIPKSKNNEVLDSIYNNGDMFKWQFFVNYFDSRKRETRQMISGYELKLIIDSAMNVKYKLIFAILFGKVCNYIDKLEDREHLYSIITSDNNTINLYAFLIIVCFSRSLDTHYFETIDQFNIIKRIAETDNIDDILFTEFCYFITSALYYGKIDMKKIESLFVRTGFIKNFISYICSANNILDDIVEKVLIPAKILIAQEILKNPSKYIHLLFTIYKRMNNKSKEYVLLLIDFCKNTANLSYYDITVDDILKVYEIKDNRIADEFVSTIVAKNLIWKVGDWIKLLKYYKGNRIMSEKILKRIKNSQYLEPKDYISCYEIVYSNSDAENV